MKKRKRVNKCPSWDEHWGCAVSPMKKCNGCPNADWHYESEEAKQEYLDKLDKDDLFSILKYGLRNSNAPEDVTVEDIYYVIQSNPI